MNNNLKVFTNDLFGEVRVTTKDGKFLFCASDVAQALGYKRPNDAINQHCRGTVKCRIIDSLGREQSANFIPEGDIYRLIIRSKLPSAIEFEHWVTDIVIPNLRSSSLLEQFRNKTTIKSSLVEINNNKIVTSSLQIAQHFEKEHKVVIRAIENSTAQNCALLDHIFKSDYTASNGKLNPMYYLDRDAFSFIVMGFTGAKASKWKWKYIEAFNQMEKQLKGQLLPDFTNPIIAARAWADAKEQNKLLEEQVKVLQPKADFADTITACKTSIPVGTFAKIVAKKLDIGRNRLFEKLRYWGLLMTLPSEFNKPTQKAIALGIFETEEKTFKENLITVKVKITPRGQQYIYNKLKNIPSDGYIKQQTITA